MNLKINGCYTIENSIIIEFFLKSYEQNERRRACRRAG